MGVNKLLSNIDNAMSALSRATVMRALLGQPAQSKNEAALHDVVDLIPIVGDGASFRRIMTNKGNRLDQMVDAVIGAIPIIGDLADFFAKSDTNIVQFEESKIKDMGPMETILTAKWFDNMIERYVGGEDRPIWHD